MIWLHWYRYWIRVTLALVICLGKAFARLFCIKHCSLFSEKFLKELICNFNKYRPLIDVFNILSLHFCKLFHLTLIVQLTQKINELSNYQEPIAFLLFKLTLWLDSSFVFGKLKMHELVKSCCVAACAWYLIRH